MKLNEKELEKHQKLVFNYAFYHTGNIETSEDIASQTMCLFLLSTDKIKDDDVNGWLINTTKNYCNQFFDNSKKELKKANNYRHEFMEQLYEQNDIGHNETLKEAFQDSFNILNYQEMKTLLYYFQCNENIKEMQKNIGISYTALKMQISRIKRKLKAETFKRLGYIGSKRIVTPQLNNLIIKFLCRFKKNLEAGTIDKMYYYFSEVDLKNYNPAYEIKKILDYEIRLSESVYKVWIFFKNNKDKTDSFYIEFYIDDKNHLKILTPPQKPLKVFKFKADSEDGMKILQMLNSAPVDRTGVSKFSDEELVKILKQIEKNKE